MARGSIFKASLSPEQLEVEQRLRTLALMLVGLAVIACGLYYLEGILIPLVLALALTYTLQPMIDLLSKRPLHLCGRKFFAQQPAAIREARPMLRPFYELVYLAKLPWWLATCIAVSVAVLVLVGLGFLVADSVQEFAAEADAYAKRIEDLTAGALNYMDEVSSSFQLYLNVSVVVPANATSVEVAAVSHRKRIEQIAKKIPVTDLITTVLETLFTLMSDLATVLLFAVYLLVGSAPSAADDDFETLPDEVTTAAPDEEARGEQGGASGATPPSGVRKGPRAKKGAASRAIQAYIRAKVSVSFFVGVVTAAALAAIGLELWLVFAILGFWLNFVPVIGTVFAIALPMPIVLLDPDFNLAHVLVAFLVPGAAHALAGNVLEPYLFGKTLDLSPVVILCSLMVWAALWGITGMVLAVPITAVLRIKLEHIDSHMTRYLAGVLAGTSKSLIFAETAPDGEDKEKQDGDGGGSDNGGGGPLPPRGARPLCADVEAVAERSSQNAVSSVWRGEEPYQPYAESQGRSEPRRRAQVHPAVEG